MGDSRKRNMPLRTIVLLATVSAVATAVTVVGIRTFAGSGGFARACEELLDTGAAGVIGPFAVSESDPAPPPRCIAIIGPQPVDVELALTRPPDLLNESDVLGSLYGNIPHESEEIGTGGQATAHFLVDETGVVQQHRITESSGYEALDEALLAIGPLASFSPTETEDGPSETWVAITVGYRVNQGALQRLRQMFDRPGPAK
jgi:TonB family protein